MIRRFRTFLLFMRQSSWVDQPTWTKDDATELAKFMDGPHGIKLKTWLLNYVLRSQANAVTATGNRDFECGHSFGCRATVTQFEALADPNNFTDDKGTEPTLSDE